MMTQPQRKRWPASRRKFALLGAILCAVAAAVTWMYGEQSGSGTFGTGVFVRSAIVLALLWLAYPSLQRPLRWFPPAVIVVFLIGIGVMVAHPKLLPAMLPLLGIAGTVLGILTWLRKAAR